MTRIQNYTAMQNPQPKIDYRFYATLLDGFSDLLDSDSIWNQYWGWSENPPHTPEEFAIIKEAEFIDRINRCEKEPNEAADKGTCFNEIVDCLISGLPTSREDMTIKSSDDKKTITATLNGFTFTFPTWVCKRMAESYRGAISQHYVSAILHTSLGNVELYGYIDELMPFSTHDIKTTKSYSVGKFKHHWQHIVYPYALYRNGIMADRFDYDVVEFPYGKTDNPNFYQETYMYVENRDLPRLVEHCENLIMWLQDHRSLITDKRIFGGVNPEGYVGTHIDINLLK